MNKRRRFKAKARRALRKWQAQIDNTSLSNLEELSRLVTLGRRRGWAHRPKY